MLLLLAASQLSAATPVNIEKWIGPDDFPSSVSIDSQITKFELVTQTLVDSTGRIVGCRIETPSENPKVDAFACALILKRARFTPATWTDGTPVPGLYRRNFAFRIFGDTLEHFGDIEIGVARLPDGIKSPAFVEVAFATNADGRVGECIGPTPPKKDVKPKNPQLVSLACSAVKAQWKPFTVMGPDGKPSRSVQNVVVKFSSDEKR